MSGSVILFTIAGMISKMLESLKLVRGYNGTSSTVWLYYLYNIPFTVSIVMAPSFILAISYITSELIQNKEFMVVRSSGRSIKRTVLPILIFSFFFSFLLLGFNEYIAYPGNLQAYAKKNELRGRPFDVHAWRARYQLNLRSNNRVFFMNVFIPSQKKVLGLHMVELNQDAGIKKIIRAEEALIVPRAWLLKDAEIITFKNSVFEKQTYYQKKKENIPEDFTVFQRIYYGVEEANIFQLFELISLKKQRGTDQTEFEIEFYWHLGFPFVCFFLIPIGVFVAFKVPGGGIASSLSISVLCAITYFVIMFYIKALGISHTISPFWAGSLGNLLMGSASLFLWFKYVD